MANELEIIGITSGEPYNSSDEPAYWVVQGRAEAGVAKVLIKLRSDVGPPFSLLAQGEAPVHVSATGDYTWGWSAQASDFGLTLFCGRGFIVEAIGLDQNGDALQETMASRPVQLVCKPPPPNTYTPPPPPTGGGNGPSGWPFPWPPVPCPTAAEYYTLGLLFALLAFVAALAWLSIAWLGVAAAVLVPALFYYFFWRACANPSQCTRYARLLWVLKWAVVGGLAIGLLGLSIPALALVLGYGIITALLLLRMTNVPCRVPSALTHWQNLP